MVVQHFSFSNGLWQLGWAEASHASCRLGLPTAGTALTATGAALATLLTTGTALIAPTALAAFLTATGAALATTRAALTAAGAALTAAGASLTALLTTPRTALTTLVALLTTLTATRTTTFAAFAIGHATTPCSRPPPTAAVSVRERRMTPPATAARSASAPPVPGAGSMPTLQERSREPDHPAAALMRAGLAYFANYQDLYWMLDDAQQPQLLALPLSAFDDDRSV
jgi:hypothetical protein